MEIKHRTQLPELLKYFNLPLVACEAGCAEGYNSRDLVDNGINELHMVDNWNTIEGQFGDGSMPVEWHSKNFNEAMARMENLPGKTIWVHIGLSYEVAKEFKPKSLSLVYLDADHSYEGVMKDLKAYYPLLVNGGIMAGHDYLNKNYGVFEAVRDFCNGLKLEIHTIPENKEEDAGFWFQV